MARSPLLEGLQVRAVSAAERQALYSAVAPKYRELARALHSAQFPTGPQGVRDYIELWRATRPFRTVEGYEQAMSRVEAKREELAAALQRAFTASSFDEAAQRGLTSGAELGLAMGAAGLALGPIGAVVGGAVGFLAGLIAGVWPFEKQTSLDTWRSIVKGLTAAERYLMLPLLRGLSDDAMIRQGRRPWPAWRIGDEGQPLGHTIFEGEDVLVLFAFEILCEHAPFIASEDPAVRAWALAMLASYHEDATKLRAARHLNGLAESGALGPWASRLFLDNRERKCGELRDSARAFGYEDFAKQPEFPELATALAEAARGGA